MFEECESLEDVEIWSKDDPNLATLCLGTDIAERGIDGMGWRCFEVGS